MTSNTNNKTSSMVSHTFTLYTAENFKTGSLKEIKSPKTKASSNKKLSSSNGEKKQQKKKKSTLVRIPRVAEQPLFNFPRQQPISELIKNIDSEILQRYYRHARLIEFTNIVRNILNERLQPGFSKFGHWLFLGSCPHDLVKLLFSSQKCLHWQTQQRSIVDGETQRYPRDVYYFNHVMPNFGVKDWFIRNHGNGNGHFLAECRSMYVELIFIINQHDDRIYCHYRQVSQARFLNGWMDIA